MTNSYKLTEDAERDVIDIYLFTLEHFGLAQAEKYFAEMFTRFDTIAKIPDLGRDYSDIYPGAFRVNQGSHAVYYRRVDGAILILRILHQAMDPARHLGG
ncbi:type II toxin-antitoxin system RelE/ParE family toxin [Paracoccus sp. DMF-8]|uniref:type II toxin-antitoxin system RelE/ParE family toxin n=1 Tax=Paracoccus sp. DMF-8 TaxID=3019445 RepID=UPI0023E7DED2|nr:type II toxin-antitoxin system RelE/ParE family toxin [Paracoccus sp. DMF-8]MDF3606226.1 type II toxin-antitoxin system RelE/ParE family toxin [Paracoccus sp. DMF-8]